MGLKKTRKTCQCRPPPGRDLYPGPPEHEEGMHSTRTRLSGCNAFVLMDIKRLNGKRLRTFTLNESPLLFRVRTKFRSFCIKFPKASVKRKFRTVLTLTDRKPMWNTNSPNWRVTWILKLGPLFYYKLKSVATGFCTGPVTGHKHQLERLRIHVRDATELICKHFDSYVDILHYAIKLAD
jgi:hypothetical protein